MHTNAATKKQKVAKVASRHIGTLKALDQAYMLRIVKVACWYLMV
ncbi:protein of unknown function [Oenococcus oeni]|uniref:Uncharacterized protein n=1 Tax=Oenococcus oeni TaxID=1247 RepID=A0AAQ2ZE28_OENOE|nr:hypothetical protein [Oenococcus oeni]SYW05860.1 hypothetical protein OENI_1480002 [Oenococcus oeni]VDB97506.1 protein of unknown function [Oenococcus oeni]